MPSPRTGSPRREAPASTSRRVPDPPFGRRRGSRDGGAAPRWRARIRRSRTPPPRGDRVRIGWSPCAPNEIPSAPSPRSPSIRACGTGALRLVDLEPRHQASDLLVPRTGRSCEDRQDGGHAMRAREASPRDRTALGLDRRDDRFAERVQIRSCRAAPPNRPPGRQEDRRRQPVTPQDRERVLVVVR